MPRTFAILTSWSVLSCPWKNGAFRNSCASTGINDVRFQALGGGFRVTYERGESAPDAPEVETVVVHLEIDQKFWPFEATRSYSDIVFCPRVVEFCETPIDEAKLWRHY